MKCCLIVAIAEHTNIIGIDGKIPWNVPEDMKWFKTHTSYNSILMGRKTFESLPCILPNRLHIVTSRNPKWRPPKNVIKVSSVEEGIDYALKNPFLGSVDEDCHDLFVIGGASIYAEVMKKNLVDYIYMSKIFNDISIEEKNSMEITYCPDVLLEENLDIGNKWKMIFGPTNNLIPPMTKNVQFSILEKVKV